MSGLLSVGTRALQANQVALQTAGNNIANVNTPGYSRQTVVLQTVPGQFSGGGYIGKGVEVQTIQRNFSAFLTRQSTLASSTLAADSTRVDKLKQLEEIFGGGSTGLGAAVSDMLNAFSDVASAPTDLTARTVVLTQVDETAARMRASSQRMDDLQQGVTQELTQRVGTINSLAKNIANVNDQIARAQGSGQPPNDLLDQRDQLVRELNQYVQTTSVAADDGTMSIFVGGSQPLVLGTTAATVALVADAFGVPDQKLAINRNGLSITLDENTLGGGEVSGLLRFQNTDLAEGRNLLGRLTLAVTTTMNDQHKLGVDLDGNVGGNLFTPADISKNVFPASLNTGSASLALSVSDASQFVASDYEVSFSTPATTPASGIITSLSDKVPTPFTLSSPVPPALPEVTIDGLKISMTGTPNAGDRFLLKPFSTSASDIRSEFSSPRALAVASPIVGSIGASNTGGLQLVSVKATGQPSGLTLPPSPVLPATTGGGVQLSFSAGPPIGYIVTGSNATPAGLTPADFTAPYTPGVTVVRYTPGAPISIDGWEITLNGTPNPGDSVTIGNGKDAQYGDYLTRNAGNASAMMGLRDLKLFDGAVLTDGYAGLIAQVGIRAQSATSAAEISSAIASNLERDRAGVSGVNLDEEAAKLLQFQQAYQASAKMIQIAQGIFDTLIQSMGR
jgi:flagellar hook-associated protein 1 FlgK